ncbi:glycosyl transferase family 4 [Palleronia aestuarii]|uniref:Glycosyl transferase family 4 n=1 Tax=Palleronia aestuarii TaxID=568105 RepID=A0A2W7NDV6_9RHOB|nr:glycosyltransferase [Palleronia aestuarii]PZX18348.1 glycosyl transferase family 4 [Palleronia aestuarii]
MISSVTRPASLPRAALVVGNWPTTSQTFVMRHASKLFDGRTCVVANTTRAPVPSAPPVFDRSAYRRGPFEAVACMAPMARNRLIVGTGHIPTGSERRAIADFLRDQGVTVILSEFGTKAIILADIAAEMGLPCYTYFRGSDASKELALPRRRRSYAYVIPKLTGVIAVSRFLLDNLAARGISHPNAHVIPSGVDVRRFEPGAKRPGSFLAVGRMVEKKAPDLTLRAFAKATRDRPEAHLRMIGDGPLLARTRDLASELGIAGKVVFEGAQAHDTVREALATTEVFLQHSITAGDGNAEGLPTAIQEALAAGCVVISTRHAGIPEAVDPGVTGWLSAERDLAGFTDLIREARHADLATMSQAARNVALERFDNTMLLHRLETVLTQDGSGAPR